jgi:histidyl-tRNA synthetase
MSKKGISEVAIARVLEILQITDLDSLKSAFSDSETGLKGVEELETVFEYLEMGTLHNEVQFDITLARGLNYYTGCIFEVKAKGVEMGSIGGGGRYDDLTSVFGMKGTSGVGVSFGAERIFDVMEELDLFPQDDSVNLKMVFVAFDDASHRYAFKWLNRVRAAGINAEIYPEPVKLKKQMKYADARNVPYVALVGSEEMKLDKVALKNMASGEQQKVSLEELITQLSK